MTNTVTIERKDFISIDGLTAISAEGDVFNIGDIVIHDGDELERPAMILGFEINKETYDVIAMSIYGVSRISFLIKSDAEFKEVLVVVESDEDGVQVHAPSLENTIIGTGNDIDEAKIDFYNSYWEVMNSYSGEIIPEELRNIKFKFERYAIIFLNWL